MVGTVVLCILSMTAFCMCSRGVLALTGGKEPMQSVTSGASMAAKRMARGYLIFSLVILALLAFAGVVVSYQDLFGKL